MYIYLIRHTKYLNPENVFAFHLPFPLSEAGISEAEKIGRWFKAKNILHLPIFTSPIARALQTARVIGSNTDSEIITDERLTETSCPELQGTKIPKKEFWKFEEDNPSRESHEKELKRMLDIFSEKMKKNKDCIFVSHGDPLTLLTLYLKNQNPPRYFWDPRNRSLAYQRGIVTRVKINSQNVVSVEFVFDPALSYPQK